MNGIPTIGDLWNKRREFSFATFGPPSHRGPMGPLLHLEKEAREAQAKPGDIYEYADCLILTLDAADRAGFTLEDLLSAAIDKNAENSRRVWPDWRGADPNKEIEHVRSSGVCDVAPDAFDTIRSTST